LVVTDHVMRLVAALLAASLVLTAWSDASQAWDVGYYHLPFAARLVGIIDSQSYVFTPLNQARFDGYPKLAEWLQGILWKVTGRAESANYVSLGSLFFFAWWLRRTFRVSAAYTLIACLAIPLVQTHAASAYVDLPANVGLTIVILIAYRHVTLRSIPSKAEWAFAVAAAAFAANIKFQLVPIVALSLVGLAFITLRQCHRKLRAACLIGACIPIVFMTPLVNLLRFHNPVWPVQLRLFGRSLPFVEEAYASSPEWLASLPRPVRWCASLSEFGLAPIASHNRWSIDQWTPPSAPGFRMGGFFGIYVLAILVFLAASAVARPSRASRVAFVFMGCVSAVASVMPQSHELRYYLFWMLLLVSFALISAMSNVAKDDAGLRKSSTRRFHRGVDVDSEPSAPERRRRTTFRTVWGWLSLGTLACVIWSTQGVYLRRSGMSFRDLIAAKTDRAIVEHAGDGEHICIMQPPWSFLYDRHFHPARTYVVHEAETPEECSSARPTFR